MPQNDTNRYPTKPRQSMVKTGKHSMNLTEANENGDHLK